MVSLDAPAFRELYPFASHRFDNAGLAYHYLDEGPREGVPVVMVHGNPTWSFFYRDLVKALRGTRRCLVPDHIGMGLSDKPGDDRYRYTLASRVDDLERFLDCIDAPVVDVVAHDWGGMIASAWMVKHPERVRRIVLMNTAAFRNPRGHRLPPTLKLARDSAVGAWLVERLNAFSLGATYLAVTRPMRATVREGFTLPYDGPARRIATLRFVQDIPLDEGDPAYAVVEATERGLPALADKPMLLPWGMRDFVFDGLFLERFRAHFPNAEVERYDDAGHYLLEDAGPRVIERIARFLGA
jgi:pimeloyl-ACP methyl ester carboxylesterase